MGSVFLIVVSPVAGHPRGRRSLSHGEGHWGVTATTLDHASVTGRGREQVATRHCAEIATLLYRAPRLLAIRSDTPRKRSLTETFMRKIRSTGRRRTAGSEDGLSLAVVSRDEGDTEVLSVA